MARWQTRPLPSDPLPVAGHVSVLVRGGVAFAAAAVVLWGWLLASPHGSSPDDGYHLASIWCARGFQDDRCIENPAGRGDRLGLVPATIEQTVCYAYDSSASAACVDAAGPGGDRMLVSMPSNLGGERADLYYRAAHTFVGDDVTASIGRIRAANAALTLLLITLTALLAAPHVRRALLVSWVVGSVPLGLFLVTSTNSSAWGLAGLGTVWANVITAWSPGRLARRVAAGALGAVGALMAVGARTEALPHLLIILVTVTVLLRADLAVTPGDRPGAVGGRPRRPPRPLVVAGAALVGLGLFVGVVMLAPDTLRGAFGNLAEGWERLSARGVGNPLVALTLEIPQLWTGALGTWSLGWLDTHVPPITSTLTLAVYGGLLWAGLQQARPGRAVAAAIAVAGLVVLPLYSLLSFGLVVQEELQARHYMPLLYLLLAVALVRSRGQRPLHIGRGGLASSTVALAIAHAAALHINIHRYTIGLTELRFADTRRATAWWWVDAPGPTVVWAVTSIAFGLLAWAVLRMLVGRPAQPVSDATERAVSGR
jgi:hypothetical protein